MVPHGSKVDERLKLYNFVVGELNASCGIYLALQLGFTFVMQNNINFGPALF
jgi:3-oxoacyl-[acyl-carrier-protein] synthase III